MRVCSFGFIEENFPVRTISRISFFQKILHAARIRRPKKLNARQKFSDFYFEFCDPMRTRIRFAEKKSFSRMIRFFRFFSRLRAEIALLGAPPRPKTGFFRRP